MNKIPKLQLKAGRESSIQKRHPWVFSGALNRLPDWQPGSVVDLSDCNGAFCARGFYNPKSQIAFRVLSYEQDVIDQSFIAEKIKKALAIRPAEPAGRMFWSEADGLSGLIVDRYGHLLVYQILSAGVDRLRAEVRAALKSVYPDCEIFERSDDNIRKKEGLGPVVDPSPEKEHIEFIQDGLRFETDVQTGHKTGFYFDQRASRRLVASYCRDASVLDCCTYTGGFSLYAAQAGASHLTMIDQSQNALAQAERHLALNGFSEHPRTSIHGDAFAELRKLNESSQKFDVIILDPPKLVTHKGHLQRALRGYKDLNMQAMRLLKSNGILATFSCSGLVDEDLFRKVVFGASVDAGMQFRVVETMKQSPDHPVLLHFPESWYLKGLLLQRI